MSSCCRDESLKEVKCHILHDKQKLIFIRRVFVSRISNAWSERRWTKFQDKGDKSKFPLDKSQVVEEKFQDVGWEETIVEKKDVAKPHVYKKN